MNSENGFLTIVVISVAFLVIFRLVFAILYICKWRCKYTFDPKYRLKTRSLFSDVRAIKKKHAVDGDSTEDELIKETVNQVFEENKVEILSRVHKFCQ